VEEKGIPLYDELVFVANRNSLDDSHLRRFIRAVEQAIHYLINYPEQSWKLFVKRYPELNNELHRRAWDDTLVRFALRPAALDHGRYKHFAQFLMKQGIVHTALPVSNYAVELAD
jgi:putative hydroxymethylpyrimidine transport system substrate-binding protein